MSGIERTPGVCGGDACIAGTRIPVWVLEGFRRLGWTEAQILASYPTRGASELATGGAFVVAHGPEIDEAIRINETA